MKPALSDRLRPLALAIEGLSARFSLQFILVNGPVNIPVNRPVNIPVNGPVNIPASYSAQIGKRINTGDRSKLP